MRQISFKRLQLEDLSVVKDIYNYYVNHSTATFHTEDLKEEDLQTFLPIDNDRYPSYLIWENDVVVGYMYLNFFKPRAAYDRTSELTVYLKKEAWGKGIGQYALEFLENKAKEGGIIKVLMAVITGNNIGSIRLFEKHGYEKSAHLKQVGEKFGKILDVVIYQKNI
ncbi:GNAT family N-acetyltransferase [Flammeovirga yaeyamensis]|uniref:GNAT family N-acetyltransferase n=1 Tax=Flammeovirga yaeyamensis TaxID=367791 RepID=A0AAX1NCD3_9BACT|nr:GNAT family N-acetyltransferase [Flammeovirga yaeyamensis]MBB3696944.1 phosphinothricin acetyltransferase [Flammeovirga yaeyamensis]NMF33607.1 N-acetyltransferase [Flammeovirga yaeyamensis]QWG05125.1 GNAT family N-acetyltransferase [Flammeovirga yaeyamensis]